MKIIVISITVVVVVVEVGVGLEVGAVVSDFKEAVTRDVGVIEAVVVVGAVIEVDVVDLEVVEVVGAVLIIGSLGVAIMTITIRVEEMDLGNHGVMITEIGEVVVEGVSVEVEVALIKEHLSIPHLHKIKRLPLMIDDEKQYKCIYIYI